MDLADNNEIMEIIKGHIDAGMKSMHVQHKFYGSKIIEL